MGDLDRYTMINKINSKYLCHTTQNYIQHSIITYIGKGSEKQSIDIFIYIYTYRHIYLNHFIVQLNLTEHCKTNYTSVKKLNCLRTL